MKNVRKMNAWAKQALVVLLAGAMGSCGSDKPKAAEANPRDLFLGEWKSDDTNSTTHTVIRRKGDTYFIHEGLNDLTGIYDSTAQVIMIDNGVNKVPVKYLPETGQLLVTGGSRDAKFSRVKK
ncbi:hypothetical protein [Hymenobacter properus]|uniref:Lipocalin-like domain-containing protein n=1 Tax=Hymenobacter properus TaxID=2791026 RepID=A0A931BLY6_9BACT|nr:hypothetical protein [Hymenobacter properus]MBF9143771.1 hypothetical protein [Hymenobacter properus]MBR7722584.1 hypothetical protein [Microvirga sp. SRT04]